MARETSKRNGAERVEGVEDTLASATAGWDLGVESLGSLAPFIDLLVEAIVGEINAEKRGDTPEGLAGNASGDGELDEKYADI